jgi:Txe/YoeB family toxin of Txe-Axe toxin-antitoxin module
MERINSEIAFGNEEIKEDLGKLKDEDIKLYEQLIKAFKNLQENAFCGIQIPKKLIPREYYNQFAPITNLWKYNLPDAWRLIYTIKNNEAVIFSVILEWLDHKTYERRFNY